MVLVCRQQKRAFGGWERSRRRNRNQYMASTWGQWLQKKLEDLSAALLQIILVMLAEKRETSPPIFVFHIPYFCPSWRKRPSPCFQHCMYPRRCWLCLLGSRVIIYTLQGRHNRRFVGDSAFHAHFGRTPLLVGDTAEVVSPLQQAQS